MLRNLNRTIDSTVELEAAAQAKLAEQREQLALEEESQTGTSEGNVEGLDAKVQMQNLVFKSEMTTAAKKFNLKPKSGLKYLVERGYLKEEPQADYIRGIVRFLKETPALSTTAIGAFLGENKDLNVEVLSAYIEEFDWSREEVDFVSAMKEMLTGFRIPGEG